MTTPSAAEATTAPRIFLVDDHGLCRQGLADLLSRTAGMEVVASIGRPEESLALIQELQPDLVVLDLRMGSSDGIAVLKHLREHGVETPVVILTMSEASEDLAAALRLGVRGYLLKDMEPADIVDGIRRAVRGELVVAPAIASKLSSILQGGAAQDSASSVIKQLTGRERQILSYVAAGLSNKAIAKTLGISHDTVKLHVRHILAKLGVGSRVEAAVFAVENRATLGTVVVPPRPLLRAHG